MPIKIKLTENNRKLETLVKGDVLIFPDRQEKIKVIDKEMGWIYTQRIKGNVEERVCYELKKDEVNPNYIINQNSEGNVYARVRIGAKK